MGLPESILTRNQKKVLTGRPIDGYGTNATLSVELRYDDKCGNGHNSFAITGEVRSPRRRDCEACGCLHDEISSVFPELTDVIKWHLCSSDGPMYYIKNTVYWVQQGNLKHARSTAIWPDATDDDLRPEGLKDRLLARLPGLMEEFRVAMVGLGFVY